MLDGLTRAWAVTKEAYGLDRKRPRIKRTRDELEFLPAAVEVLETPASPVGRTVALLIVGVVVAALVWAWFGEIDTVAVAQGRIIPGGHVKVIQPLEIGGVRAIHVKNGQHVIKGEVLIELDPTEAGANRERLMQDLSAARLDVARLSALARGGDPLEVFEPTAGTEPALVANARALLIARASEYREGVAAIDGEIAQRRAERATIRARINRLGGTVPLLRQRVEAYRYLVKREIGRKLLLLELEEQLVGQQRDRTVERRRLQEVAEAIKVLKRRRAERTAAVAAQIQSELTEALHRRAALAQELRKAEERYRQRLLRSPVTGTVQQLAVHTVGGVVTPAERLMVVVPEDSPLEIEAMVLNKDVGFVAVDQPVEIKIESFPFTKFGLIDGSVAQISVDAVPDEKLGLVYPARIAMARDEILVGDRWVKLGPGMAVTAEVKTGKRRVLEFFLSPFLRYQNDAMRER